MVLSNEMMGTDWPALPERGRIECALRRLPLMPGQYHINVYCTVNGVLADWVQDAATITVEPGDYFGTGKLPPSSHGGLLVGQEWNLRET
jgi:lipopolysaccharide transport system ATP-binding protein